MNTARSFKPRAEMSDGWVMDVGIMSEDDFYMPVPPPGVHSPLTDAESRAYTWHYYGVSMFALYLPDSIVQPYE